MKKISLIAGIVLFILGMLTILTRFRSINLPYSLYIANIPPIKDDHFFFNGFLIPLIYIALGYGLFLHYRNKAFSLSILAFFFSVVLIDNLYRSLTLLREILFPAGRNLDIPEYLIITPPTLAEFLSLLLSSLIYIAIAAICLKIIIPKLPGARIRTSGKQKIGRMINWGVDVLVMSQILFGKLPMHWIKYVSDDETIMLTVVAAVHVFLYYSFFEILYRRTPGKFLTNTSVTNTGNTNVTNTGNTKPSVPVILLRTMLRLIPFEFLSFLFSANWHDRLSNTRVN